MRFLWPGLVVLVMAGCADSSRRDADLAGKVRQALVAKTPDSDAAVILAAALADADAASADKRPEILEAALNRAAESRSFTPTFEAPLPEGWPAPSLPGLIRIKTYPALRAA
jgi:hypothetical protein